MALPALRVLELCAGVGALGLGIARALPARTVSYVEREAFAASRLVAGMEAGRLDSAPVWDDLLAFDGGAWRGAVDLVAAGFPCQPWSAAGKRAGTGDERWIWDRIAGLIRDVGPSVVVLENVPGLALGGLEHVLGSLASLGFDAEWGVFAASEAGAPHRRERLFLLAWRLPDADLRALWLAAERRSQEQAERRDPEPGHLGDDVADASGSGCEGPEPEPERGPFQGRRALADASHDGRGRQRRAVGERSARREGPPGDVAHGLRDVVADAAGERRDGGVRLPGRGPQEVGGGWRDRPADRHASLADADRPPGGQGNRREHHAGRGAGPQDGVQALADAEHQPTGAEQVEQHGQRPDVARGGRLPPEFPPGPSDLVAWARVAEAAPELLPAEPAFRRVADGAAGGSGDRTWERIRDPERAHELRALGNAVVPAQAALAIRELLGRAVTDGR